MNECLVFGVLGVSSKVRFVIGMTGCSKGLIRVYDHIIAKPILCLPRRKMRSFVFNPRLGLDFTFLSPDLIGGLFAYIFNEIATANGPRARAFLQNAGPEDKNKASCFPALKTYDIVRE